MVWALKPTSEWGKHIAGKQMTKMKMHYRSARKGGWRLTGKLGLLRGRLEKPQ
jgi:hypothetical protein